MGGVAQLELTVVNALVGRRATLSISFREELRVEVFSSLPKVLLFRVHRAHVMRTPADQTWPERQDLGRESDSVSSTVHDFTIAVARPISHFNNTAFRFCSNSNRMRVLSPPALD